MSKRQLYLISLTCIIISLIFAIPISQIISSLVAVILCCVLIGIGAVFFIIGANE